MLDEIKVPANFAFCQQDFVFLEHASFKTVGYPFPICIGKDCVFFYVFSESFHVRMARICSVHGHLKYL